MKPRKNEGKVGSLAPIQNFIGRPKMSMDIPTNLTNISVNELK